MGLMGSVLGLEDPRNWPLAQGPQSSVASAVPSAGHSGYTEANPGDSSVAFISAALRIHSPSSVTLSSCCLQGSASLAPGPQPLPHTPNDTQKQTCRAQESEIEGLPGSAWATQQDCFRK